MSILNTKKNEEKTKETGAKKSFRNVCIFALATGLITTAVMAKPKLENYQFSCEAQKGNMTPVYCETLRELAEISYDESVEHILFHLNQDEAISNIEIHEQEIIEYMLPAGYIKITITDQKNGTTKILGQKEYIDENGKTHIEYIEPEIIKEAPHIEYIYETDEGYKMQCKLIYIDDETHPIWTATVPTLIEETKTLTK